LFQTILFENVFSEQTLLTTLVTWQQSCHRERKTKLLTIGINL